MVVTTEDEEVGRRLGGGQPFWFEVGWVQEENYEVIVCNAWNLSMEVRAGKVTSAIKDIAADLWDGSTNILDDLEKRIKHMIKELEACTRRGINYANVAREEILKYKLDKLEDQKELHW